MMGAQREGSVAEALPRVWSAPWSRATRQLVAHLLFGMPLALPAFGVLLVLGAFATGLAPTGLLALPFLAGFLGFSRSFARFRCDRITTLLGVEIETEHRPALDGPRSRRLLNELREAGTWRRLGYHALSAAAAAAGLGLVVGCWAAGLVLATVYLGTTGIGDHLPYVLGLHQPELVVLTLAGFGLLWLSLGAARAAAWADVSLARWLLGPSRRQLTERLFTLTQTRAQVVDAADAERRRLERDLHDGVQQQLVSLSMNLGMTRRMANELPDPARQALEQAHVQAKQTLADLRQLVRGLHPAVLDELGLDAALSGIVARSPVPGRLSVDLPHRPAQTIEAVAYFVVSEALTNVAKHSGATRVEVRVEHERAEEREMIKVVVEDDGRGGADTSGGTGLRGLAQRVGAADGVLRVDSPVGGPTVVTVELPCVS